MLGWATALSVCGCHDGGPAESGTDGSESSSSEDGAQPADTSSGSDVDPASTSGVGEDSENSSSTGEEVEPDEACERDDPFPSVLEDDSGLFEEQGSIRFVARDGNVLTAYTHRSTGFDPQSGPIVFIMHGAGRNASGYLNQWRALVEEHGALALAPEFTSELYPGSESYNLGVGVNGTPYGGDFDPEAWRDPADYTHSEIEHLFEAVRAELGNASCRYRIYGHSAGGQFVHRLLTFRPDARVARAVAANAGWYTLPSDGGGSDEMFHMPYGLQGAPPDRGRIELLFSHDLVVLLGEDDVLRDSQLRKTAEADFQGLNRFERGQFYFETAKQEADAMGLDLAWTLDTVPGVAHSNAGMTPPAAAYLFSLE